MRPVATALLVLLPVCLAFHYQVQPFNMGNKRRTAQKVVWTYNGDLGDCEQYIKSKNIWSQGMSFRFEVRLVT